jgi:hypothetical protein
MRKAFQEAGMLKQEREVTHALKRQERESAGPIEGSLNFTLFEATSEWGMNPGRPVLILLALLPVFAIFYIYAIHHPTSRSAVWKVWDKERVRREVGWDDPEPVNEWGWRAILYGLFFSLTSAFHIGWREVNVGDWINRINPGDYVLRATGWVKAVSGVQSLISVYLLALAVLTYFGRPFE